MNINRQLRLDESMWFSYEVLVVFAALSKVNDGVYAIRPQPDLCVCLEESKSVCMQVNIRDGVEDG